MFFFCLIKDTEKQNNYKPRFSAKVLSWFWLTARIGFCIISWWLSTGNRWTTTFANEIISLSKWREFFICCTSIFIDLSFALIPANNKNIPNKFSMIFIIKFNFNRQFLCNNSNITLFKFLCMWIFLDGLFINAN